MFNSMIKSALGLSVGVALIIGGLFVSGEASAQDTCGTASLAPVAYGQVVTAFGDYDTQSLKSRGVVIQTAGHAHISAPAAGTVEYAGAVENMGKVVVLNIGHNYRVVLTGLSALNVTTGQKISTYDVVGAMPNSATPAKLYMELRCGEEPVNPIQTTLVAMR